MQVFTGTSGFSYKEWRGSFYPKDIKPADMLGFYAGKLSAVEINNTFYRMPKSDVMKQWRDSVPDNFRFSIKASRRITHQARLKECEESLDYLATRVRLLETKLGCVLFQLPPYLHQNIERLQSFLSAWPKELPAAIEFLHASWLNKETYDVLSEHGAAIVVSEDGELALPGQIATTPWMYLRLRKPAYTNQALGRWLARCRKTNSDQVFAFFKHEDEGAGPALANRFAQLAAKPQPQRAPRQAAKGSKRNGSR